MPATRVTQVMGIPLWTTPVIRPSGTHVPGTTEKEPIMSINLHDITGQESGVILVDTGAGRQNVVANWGDRDGLPYFMPYYAATNDPFPFLFMDVADIHVDRPLVHKGRLRDEVAHDGFDDWNPWGDDLDSDEPCVVYPLTNGWTVVAPENWN